MITKIRAKILSEVLNSDFDRAKNLVALEAEEAVKQINTLGHDFTVDEIKAYGSLISKVKAEIATGEELALDELDVVAGGEGFVTDFYPWISFTHKW